LRREMKMKKSILVVLLLLCCFAPASFADELQVTFFADFDNVIRNNLLRPTTVNGSFTWDTAAQTFSNVNITDNFNESMNTLVYSYFLEAGNPYGLPVGTMAGWTFCGYAPSACIQFSPGDHAFLGPQVIPEPGTYPTGMWFFDRYHPFEKTTRSLSLRLQHLSRRALRSSCWAWSRWPQSGAGVARNSTLNERLRWQFPKAGPSDPVRSGRVRQAFRCRSLAARTSTARTSSEILGRPDGACESDAAPPGGRPSRGRA
jgi:hypothetical protein